MGAVSKPMQCRSAPDVGELVEPAVGVSQPPAPVPVPQPGRELEARVSPSGFFAARQSTLGDQDVIRGIKQHLDSGRHLEQRSSGDLDQLSGELVQVEPFRRNRGLRADYRRRGKHREEPVQHRPAGG